MGETPAATDSRKQDGAPALVTGGCGFVGRHLVSRLLRSGREVWVIDNLSTGSLPGAWATRLGLQQLGDDGTSFVHPNGTRLEFIKGDLRAVLHRERRGARRLPWFGDVFHLAAVVGGRSNIDGNPLGVATNLSIDSEFFEWAAAAKPGRILYASSSAVYPCGLQTKDGQVALREDMVDFDSGSFGLPDMTYGWAKLSGEYLALIAARHHGLSVACVRPFSGFGEDQDRSYPIPAIAARVARREDPLVVWGSGTQGRDFLHIDDCIDIMLKAVEVIDNGSAVNAGTGRLTTFIEIATILSELEGYCPRIHPLEDKPVGVHARYADTSKLMDCLGVLPSISLQEGLSRVLQAAKHS